MHTYSSGELTVRIFADLVEGGRYLGKVQVWGPAADGTFETLFTVSGSDGEIESALLRARAWATRNYPPSTTHDEVANKLAGSYRIKLSVFEYEAAWNSDKRVVAWEARIVEVGRAKSLVRGGRITLPVVGAGGIEQAVRRAIEGEAKALYNETN